MTGIHTPKSGLPSFVDHKKKYEEMQKVNNSLSELRPIKKDSKITVRLDGSIFIREDKSRKS